MKGQNQTEDIGREEKTKIVSSHIQNLDLNKWNTHTHTHYNMCVYMTPKQKEDSSERMGHVCELEGQYV